MNYWHPNYRTFLFIFCYILHFYKKSFFKVSWVTKKCMSRWKLSMVFRGRSDFFWKKILFFLFVKGTNWIRMTNINLTDISFLPFPPEMANRFSRYLTNNYIFFAKNITLHLPELWRIPIFKRQNSVFTIVGKTKDIISVFPLYFFKSF